MVSHFCTSLCLSSEHVGVESLVDLAFDFFDWACGVQSAQTRLRPLSDTHLKLCGLLDYDLVLQLSWYAGVAG